MRKLVLLRHGQSQWNLENRFTGWTDVDLSEKGVEEAKEAGRLMREAGIRPDKAYTSVLKRAIRTLWLALDEMDRMWMPVERNWRLNERHYGALQGFNKAEMAKEKGEDLVHQWRRSFDVPPPALEEEDKRHPRFEEKYNDLASEDLPATESLKDTLARVLPYLEGEILPSLKEGKLLLVAAHGNSLRAIVKYLDKISDEEIPGLEIPTGKPLVYEFEDDLTQIKHYYLGAENS